MLKTNVKCEPETIATNLMMSMSSLNMKPPSTARVLCSNDKTKSKSTNNILNQNEQVLHNQRQEDMI